MALPFALRPRVRLSEGPPRVRSVALPNVAVPVVAYWSVMGLLTWGVASGAIRPASWFPSDPDARPIDRGAPSIAFVAPARPAVLRRSSAPRRSEPDPAPPPVAPEPAPRLSDPEPAFRRVDPDPERSPLVALVDPAPRVRDRVALEEPAPAPRPSRRKAEPWHGPWAPGDSRADVDFEPPSPRRSAPIDLSEDPLRPPGVTPDLPSPRPREASNRSVRARADHEPVVVPEAPPREAPPPRTSVGTCEAVLATANEEMDLTAARGAPDLSRDAYASILENGRYLSSCGVPAGTALEICAAVKQGRAIGVTVVARPPDARVTGCVRSAVARLPFPSSARLDVTRTRFDAVPRR